MKKVLKNIENILQIFHKRKYIKEAKSSINKNYKAKGKINLVSLKKCILQIQLLKNIKKNTLFLNM